MCDDSRVPDFIGENLTGSRFDDVYLTNASFNDVDLSNARFRLVDMTGVVIRGAALKDMSISGWIDNLLVNGIDVVPLVQAELGADKGRCGLCQRSAWCRHSVTMACRMLSFAARRLGKIAATTPASPARTTTIRRVVRTGGRGGCRRARATG